MEGCDDFNGELSGAKICVSSSLAVNFLDHKLWQSSLHLSVGAPRRLDCVVWSRGICTVASVQFVAGAARGSLLTGAKREVATSSVSLVSCAFTDLSLAYLMSFISEDHTSSVSSSWKLFFIGVRRCRLFMAYSVQ